MNAGSTDKPSAGEQGILAAATALFAEHGYDAVSIHTIAERAGVSKANVFHHFASKHALYLAVLERACRRFTELLDNVLGQSEGLRSDTRQFAEAHLDLLYEDVVRTNLVLREMLDAGDRRGGALVEAVFGENFSRLAGLFDEARQRGELRAGVEPAFAGFLLSSINVLYFRNREMLGKLPGAGFAKRRDRYVDMLCDVLLYGLVPREDESRP